MTSQPRGRYGSLWSRRNVMQPVIDSMAIAGAVVAATFMRYEFRLPAVQRRGLLVIVPIFIGVQAVSCTAAGLYARRWRYGSFEEVAALTRAVVLSTFVLTVLDAGPLRHRIPVSACLAAGPIALISMAAVRYVWRVLSERRLRPDADQASRVIVFGAGEAGDQLIAAMMRNPSSEWFPVALIDDDPALRHMTIKGVRVAGGRGHIAAVAAKTRATAMVIAVASADGPLVRDLSELARDADLRVMVLPPLAELPSGSVGIEHIRPLTEADLLGRHEIDIDVGAIAEYLTGQRVLVTGAGGSIGSELCRQISRFRPAELVMLDRDDSALHQVQLSIEGRALLDNRNLVICDIRDRDRLGAVFAEHRPQVIFHAAALKHLPLLEMHPGEAVKTNVWGTQNLLELACGSGVDRFVNISTDKAADPESVLGFSKRIGERLTAAASVVGGAFLSVRFGNVLGSRGSMLPAFRGQIEAGGPVTVTHPDVTRYFMTVEEAVQLVIQAGAVGLPGEALVLDMGEPVRIADVASRLIEQTDRHIDIEYTGLRPGEKLHEVLLSTGEEDRRPMHPLISHVGVPPLHPDRIQSITLDCSDERVISQLLAVCADVSPHVPDRHVGAHAYGRGIARAQVGDSR